MFEPSDKPRIFGLPPGVDFPKALVAGLRARHGDRPAQDLARVQLYVNTTRMVRRITAEFDAGPACILPRIRLITDIAQDPAGLHIAPPVSALRRRLELAQFVQALLDQDPSLAPRAAVFDLSDSLATLMDEMQGEGVAPSALETLDISDQSGHWAKALAFLQIISRYFEEGREPPDTSARQRLVAQALGDAWLREPHPDPIIVAGSTGSRGATALFMQAVANLPQGAVVLPGFDATMPADVWATLAGSPPGEDHPQYRFRHLMDQIGFAPHDVDMWQNTRAANHARNALVSLALRPAPVTNQWLRDGPDLGDLANAVDGMTLLEAESPRAEAETIALRMRKSVEDGHTVALITPDRILTRQVTSALARWHITPDDSAGVPLALSPPGRFLRHVADLLGRPLTAEKLLVLLKHPLCNSGSGARNQQLLLARKLELHLRRYGPAFPDAASLLAWGKELAEKDSTALPWAAWLASVLSGSADVRIADLADHLDQHLRLASLLAAGPNASTDQPAGQLWDLAAGREALRICDMLQRDADAGGPMDQRDYVALFGAVLASGVVRDPDASHPGVLILGTLEARVQTADLVILGGLNEGIWPESPAPDPWLNRQMRQRCGLLLPERQIGLSAHDFQQAVANKTVWLTRAVRSADAETVPSRWLNRILNLLRGLPDQGGTAAVDAMLAEGARWAGMAAHLTLSHDPAPAAPRPSPAPPVAARPKELSVTRISTLIRDPYTIYAQKVLRLNKLDPLTPMADGRLRGVMVHAILEKFVKADIPADAPDAADRLFAIAEKEHAANCPWPTVRAQWLASFRRSIPVFLEQEAIRQAMRDKSIVEAWGKIVVGDTGVKLTCKADRIDLTPTDEALIYDYKTGSMPSKKSQLSFEKQLLLEAGMVTLGAFTDVSARPVAEATFVKFSAKGENTAAPLDEAPPNVVWEELIAFLRAWQRPEQGYSARMAMDLSERPSDFDHLSRYGEWDIVEPAKPQVLT